MILSALVTLETSFKVPIWSFFEVLANLNFWVCLTQALSLEHWLSLRKINLMYKLLRVVTDFFTTLLFELITNNSDQNFVKPTLGPRPCKEPFSVLHIRKTWNWKVKGQNITEVKFHFYSISWRRMNKFSRPFWRFSPILSWKNRHEISISLF